MERLAVSEVGEALLPFLLADYFFVRLAGRREASLLCQLFVHLGFELLEEGIAGQ